MSLAITCEGLGKRYRLGTRERYRTLRDVLTEAVRAPFHRASRDENFIWALRDVNLEVRHGEAIGIIGRNGAGKSTLLKILSRITEPTEGGVTLRGRVGSLLEVGTGFHPELTGRENIYLNGAILGMRKAEIARKFDEIVAFAEVERFVDTPIKHYSSGMYVRLAFAVAAHLQPDILLLDEVLAVGDVEFQKKCIGTMENITKGGKTVVLVSHNMGTVRNLCTHAILLDRGTISASGRVEPVINAYLASTSTVDPVERLISADDYAAGGEKLRVRTIRLLSGGGNAFAVHWREPITIRVGFEVLETLSDVSFGAGIRLLDGGWVFSVHDDDGNGTAGERWSLDPGRYTVELTLQNDLKPGMYKLCIGAHQTHYSRNLFHLEAVNLEVLGYARNGAVPAVYDPGLINGRAHWNAPMRIDPLAIGQKTTAV